GTDPAPGSGIPQPSGNWPCTAGCWAPAAAVDLVWAAGVKLRITTARRHVTLRFIPAPPSGADRSVPAPPTSSRSNASVHAPRAGRVVLSAEHILDLRHS